MMIKAEGIDSMVTSRLWNGLRASLGLEAGAQRCVTVQPLGLGERDLQVARWMLAKASEQLGARFELRADGGDVVLLDGEMAARMSPQLIFAFNEDRPVVLLAAQQHGDDAAADPGHDESRLQDLMRQLRRVVPTHRRLSPAPLRPGPIEGVDAALLPAPHTGFDSGFDSRADLDAALSIRHDHEHLEVQRHLMQGVRDPECPPLQVGYGSGADMVFDFRQRRVFCDRLAQQQLRVRRELPRPVSQVHLQANALVWDLQEATWDIGIAAGHLPLLDAPADWWHAPLQIDPAALIERFSRAPAHLDVARRLRAGPVTPSTLRTDARLGVSELRRVLQACLMSGVVRWVAN
jgi:hypothetical protein